LAILVVLVLLILKVYWTKKDSDFGIDERGSDAATTTTDFSTEIEIGYVTEASPLDAEHGGLYPAHDSDE
jgi:hypothetical protein